MALLLPSVWKTFLYHAVRLLEQVAEELPDAAEPLPDGIRDRGRGVEGARLRRRGAREVRLPDLLRAIRGGEKARLRVDPGALDPFGGRLGGRAGVRVERPDEPRPYRERPAGARQPRVRAGIVPDPDGAHDVGSEADEPGVAVPVGRSRLPGRREVDAEGPGG